MSDLLLGVNIDHVATIRNARKTKYPDPVYAAFLAEQAGANGITVHLRQDRRHITERDIKLLAQTLQTKMNIEIATNDKIIDFICEIQPEFCCLVPEKIEEMTTEGGLDVIKEKTQVTKSVEKLTKAGIIVSVFIEPEITQIDAVAEIGAPFIEINTGVYAEAKTELKIVKELERIKFAINYANDKKLKVNAGHGLTYENVKRIAKLKGIYELNIGHAIISKAIFSGIEIAIADMKKIFHESCY
ncbi:pyridoxine 5'-phosphate synthase [Arsenophonus symbiont of Ornithomya chloropus]|uniref:pyridoxine 5'-phosphate synthase n=1 Tax=Arsenophonus symbiont of Ornithomya chloropus TaxID=634121 RepID=UPI0032B23F26